MLNQCHCRLNNGQTSDYFEKNEFVSSRYIRRRVEKKPSPATDRSKCSARHQPGSGTRPRIAWQARCSGAASDSRLRRRVNVAITATVIVRKMPENARVKSQMRFTSLRAGRSACSQMSGITHLHSTKMALVSIASLGNFSESARHEAPRGAAAREAMNDKFGRVIHRTTRSAARRALRCRLRPKFRVTRSVHENTIRWVKVTNE